MAQKIHPVDRAVNRIREAIHREVKDLDPGDYRIVLETLVDDHQAGLEALVLGERAEAAVDLAAEATRQCLPPGASS